MEHRRGEFTMEPMRMSPVQPRQRQKLLSRPSDTADGPGQDPEADQGLGANPAIGTPFKTIGGKPSRHRSTGGERHCSGLGCLQPPRQSMQRGCKYRSTTLPYNMGRRARTRVTSSVAIQTDQDQFRGILEIGAN